MFKRIGPSCHNCVVASLAFAWGRGLCSFLVFSAFLPAFPRHRLRPSPFFSSVWGVKATARLETLLTSCPRPLSPLHTSSERGRPRILNLVVLTKGACIHLDVSCRRVSSRSVSICSTGSFSGDVSCRQKGADLSFSPLPFSLSSRRFVSVAGACV